MVTGTGIGEVAAVDDPADVRAALGRLVAATDDAQRRRAGGAPGGHHHFVMDCGKRDEFMASDWSPGISPSW